jgi:hypothetical protein
LLNKIWMSKCLIFALCLLVGSCSCLVHVCRSAVVGSDHHGGGSRRGAAGGAQHHSHHHLGAGGAGPGLRGSVPPAESLEAFETCPVSCSLFC